MYISFQDYSVVDPSTDAPSKLTSQPKKESTKAQTGINHSMHLSYLNDLVLLMLYIAKLPTDHKSNPPPKISRTRTGNHNIIGAILSHDT